MATATRVDRDRLWQGASIRLDLLTGRGRKTRPVRRLRRPSRSPAPSTPAWPSQQTA